MSTLTFLHNPPRYFFFTGKGGVGKTSIAAATAIHLVEDGKKVLLVSTDPASNIGQVFNQTIGNRMVPIDTVPGLSAMEIDPEQAVEQYRERILGPMRGVVPDDELAAATEQLSGACTTEIASFNEFTGLLTDPELVSAFDHILFDTAPTGHTIRLLQLPGAWNEFLERGKGNASCLGPMSGLEKQKTIYSEAVAALADPDRTRLVLVSRAQTAALQEISRTHIELEEIGLTRQYVVINGVMPEPGPGDELGAAIHLREQRALADLPATLRTLPVDTIPLKSRNMVGVDALRTLFVPEASIPFGIAADLDDVPMPSLGSLVDELAQDDHGLVMVMGKGGVGKTTLAAAIAVALAKAGKTVHLTTTDPAAHVSATLAGELEGLTTSRIDPEVELRNYQDNVMRTRGARLSDEDRAVLAEDLRSPCYEEIAVFQAFSRAIRDSRRSFVVIDTAPTGHTLLLMDATGSYHREVSRSMGEQRNFSTPLMQLRDPEATKIIIATLAETTPVLEAESLKSDLNRAGIHPWAWIVNSSLYAADPQSPLLRARAANEAAEIRKVAHDHADRFAVVPMLRREPVGVAALEELTYTDMPTGSREVVSSAQ